MNLFNYILYNYLIIIDYLFNYLLNYLIIYLIKKKRNRNREIEK